MKENTVPAEGSYVEGDSDAAGELSSGAAPFNKSADRDTVTEGDAPFNKDFPEDLDTTKDRTGTGDEVEGDPSDPANQITKDDLDDGAKDATGTGDAVDEGPTVYNKDGDGGCPNCGSVDGMIPGKGFCADCGSPMAKGDAGPTDIPPDAVQADDMTAPVVQADDADMPVVQAGMDDLVPGGDTSTPMKDDAPPPDFAAQTADTKEGSDPNVDEILERYRNPKSNKWDTRKHKVSKSLLKSLETKGLIRTDVFGKHWLRSKSILDDTTKEDATPAQAEQIIGSGTVKDITNRLGKALDVLVSFIKDVPMKNHHSATLKHVADTIFYVGKELTDKGKLQRNTGGGEGNSGWGGPLTDKGKAQHNGGTDGDLKGGSELFGGSLESRGSQQGKTPAKGAKRWEDQPADPAVAAKFSEVLSFCKREGILNGAAK